MKIQIKNLPKLTLEKLLQRRKMSFQQFFDENKIISYNDLVRKCSLNHNVIPISEEDYKKITSFQESNASFIANDQIQIPVNLIQPTANNISLDVELNVDHFHDTETKDESDFKKRSKKKTQIND